MFNWIKKLFKKEELEYPYRWIKVCLNPIAKSRGLFGDENLIIQIVEGENKVIEEKPFTQELLESTKKTTQYPVHFEDFEDDNFEFFPFEELGLVKKR